MKFEDDSFWDYEWKKKGVGKGWNQNQKNGMAISDTGSRKKWKKEKITISNSFSPLSSNFLPDSSNPPTELSAVLESQNKSIGVIWTKKSLPFDGF